MPYPIYVHFWNVGRFSLRGTCDLLRGIVWKLVHAVRLGERVGWGISLVWTQSEFIHPAFDNFPGKCAELKCAIKLVNNPERHRVVSGKLGQVCQW